MYDIICVQAERRFEQYGRLFMENTLQLVKELRPRAKWGYYAFPYCYNYTPKNKGFDCPSDVKNENNA
jgi:hyaluronoglucosaminidase